MNISMIVATGRNNVIGKDNKMPWHLPADLKYFKKVTMGHTVVCGRRTLESMGGPLPGRRNIVLTRNKDFNAENCEAVHSVAELFHLVGDTNEEIFIIGGAEIYDIFIIFANKLYITVIEEDFEGDTYFPTISPQEWTLVSEKPGLTDENNPYKYKFRIFERVILT